MDVGTTVCSKFVAESDGRSDVGLSGDLESFLPGIDGTGVRKDSEFSGVVKIADGLDEFLLDKVESVPLLRVNLVDILVETSSRKTLPVGIPKR